MQSIYIPNSAINGNNVANLHLPEPGVETTTVPDPELIAKTYLDHWKAEEYQPMYAMLTEVSQDAISKADFSTRYKNVANEAALSGWEYEDPLLP